METFLKAKAKSDQAQENVQGGEYGVIVEEARYEAAARLNEAVAQVQLAEAALYGEQRDEDDALKTARTQLDDLTTKRDEAYKKWEAAWKEYQDKPSSAAEYFQAKADFYQVDAELRQGRADFFRTLPDLYSALTVINRLGAELYDLDAEMARASAQYNQAQAHHARVVHQDDDADPSGNADGHRKRSSSNERGENE